MFQTGAPINRNANIIANTVRINQNVQKSIIAKIQLNTGINRNKVIMSMLAKLRTTNSNLTSQINVQHQIRKRSFSDANEWTGASLQVNKLHLLDRQVDGKLLNKRNSVYNLFGKLEINRLTIGKLLKVQKSNGERTKRSLSSLDHPQIVVQSINNIDWTEFLNSVFRKGINTVIAGLYQQVFVHLLIVFR